MLHIGCTTARQLPDRSPAWNATRLQLITPNSDQDKDNGVSPCQTLLDYPDEIDETLEADLSPAAGLRNVYNRGQ